MDFNNFFSSESENAQSETLSNENVNNNVDNLSEGLNKCNEELIRQKEQYFRVVADFQNFQKRIEKEKATWLNEGRKTTLIFLIPMLDELDFAIKSAERELENNPSMKSYLEGFKLIQKNFEKRLSDFGVEQINCEGQFDPNFHEALMQVESSEHKSGDIVQVFKKGYKFKDDVLSHAKVSVAK